jgi:hypothetical protein
VPQKNGQHFPLRNTKKVCHETVPGSHREKTGSISPYAVQQQTVEVTGGALGPALHRLFPMPRLGQPGPPQQAATNHHDTRILNQTAASA